MKFFKYICMGSLLLASTSCGDEWLNLEPSTSIETESSIKILSDVEFTLNGIYSDMQASNAYSGRLVYYGDVRGDDMQAVSLSKRTGDYYNYGHTKDNGPSSHWLSLYSATVLRAGLLSIPSELFTIGTPRDAPLSFV